MHALWKAFATSEQAGVGQVILRNRWKDGSSHTLEETMTTEARKQVKKVKRALRRYRNAIAKTERAVARRKADIELSKTVIVTENEDGTKSYAFPPEPKFRPLNIPSLSHISEKTRKTGVPRKNRSGYKEEHSAAIFENASRVLAKEIDKALAPSPEVTQATIGEFTDHGMV